jgi:hypothetical protein
MTCVSDDKAGKSTVDLTTAVQSLSTDSFPPVNLALVKPTILGLAILLFVAMVMASIYIPSNAG